MYYRLLDLNNKSSDEIIALISTIPDYVSTLDLSWNSLGSKTVAELIAIVTAIPARVNSLYLSHNGFYSLTGAELEAVVVAIPSTVTSLNLKANSLGLKPRYILEEFLSSIPATITSLDLSKNELSKKTSVDLAAILAAIPATVTSLNLSENLLSEREVAELIIILRSLPSTLTSLDLSQNSLCYVARLAELFAALPASINTLNLSYNYFFQKTSAALVELVAAIPANITSLNFSENGLTQKTGAELATFLAAIPASVTSLNLSSNHLFNKTNDELVVMLAALPASLTFLNLNNNHWRARQINVIMNTLPLYIETIVLEYKIIKVNEYHAENLLVAVANLAAKKGVERLAFDSLVPTREIDANHLHCFIDFLAKKNNPIADLTCGLLLEGQIPTTSNILENCSEYDQHMEKRTHDAISFYTKAAKDATLKPMVEFLLRNIKTNCPSISVQNRLALYDLSPQDNFICEPNQVLKNRLGVVVPLLTSFGVFALSSTESDEIRVTKSFEFC